MNNLVSFGASFPISILILQTHSTFASTDPKHCQGYNTCYAIGYQSGYKDAQNGVCSAFVCVGHSEIWCSGYNDEFHAENGGSNIFYGLVSDQSANLNVHGNNNKISINIAIIKWDLLEDTNQLADFYQIV